MEAKNRKTIVRASMSTTNVFARCRDCQGSPGGVIGQSNRMLPLRDHFWVARYRKVTTWPLEQVSSGPKVVSVRPLVISFSTAQATADS